MDKAQTIQSLHADYCRLTGMEIRCDMGRERDWFEWQARGFTAHDLKMVVHYIRAGIREGKRNLGALKFSNLIRDYDKFEEDLAEARSINAANSRKPRVDPARAEALRATGRDPLPKTDAVSAKQALDRGLGHIRKYLQENK